MAAHAAKGKWKTKSGGAVVSGDREELCWERRRWLSSGGRALQAKKAGMSRAVGSVPSPGAGAKADVKVDDEEGTA
jgi:hypothetical protein